MEYLEVIVINEVIGGIISINVSTFPLVYNKDIYR